MKIAQVNSRGRYGIYVLAVILLLASVTLWFFANNSYLIQSLGGVMLLSSAMLLNKYRGSKRPNSNGTNSANTNSRHAYRPGVFVWTVGILLLITLCIIWYITTLDARHGGKEIWPLFAFTGIGIICALYWGALIGILMGGIQIKTPVKKGNKNSEDMDF